VDDLATSRSLMFEDSGERTPILELRVFEIISSGGESS
jgi:hypothetical protein